MENINADLGKKIDMSNLYIGLYESNEGERIGLFIKKDKQPSSRYEKISYQFYEDILANYYVAMILNKEGKDMIGQYHAMPGDLPEEQNWKKIIGTANFIDLIEEVPFVQDLYPKKEDERIVAPFEQKGKMAIGEIDRFFGLIELNSAIPNLNATISFDEMLNALFDFCSKLKLKDKPRQEVIKNLKSVVTHFDNNKENLPTFVNNNALEYNKSR